MNDSGRGGDGVDGNKDMVVEHARFLLRQNDEYSIKTKMKKLVRLNINYKVMYLLFRHGRD